MTKWGRSLGVMSPIQDEANEGPTWLDENYFGDVSPLNNAWLSRVWLISIRSPRQIRLKAWSRPIRLADRHYYLFYRVVPCKRRGIGSIQRRAYRRVGNATRKAAITFRANRRYKYRSTAGRIKNFPRSEVGDRTKLREVAIVISFSYPPLSFPADSPTRSIFTPVRAMF